MLILRAWTGRVFQATELIVERATLIIIIIIIIIIINNNINKVMTITTMIITMDDDHHHHQLLSLHEGQLSHSGRHQETGTLHRHFAQRSSVRA